MTQTAQILRHNLITSRLPADKAHFRRPLAARRPGRAAPYPPTSANNEFYSVMTARPGSSTPRPAGASAIRSSGCRPRKKRSRTSLFPPSGCSRAGKARPAGARPSTGRLASKRLARLFQRLARSPGRAAAGFFNGLSAGSADDRCFVPECCRFDTAFARRAG